MGQIEWVEAVFLGEKLFDGNLKMPYGRKPIHYAIIGGQLEVIKLLVEKVEPKQEMLKFGDEDGNTPLHIAASIAHPAVVRYLLDLGADIHARNKWEQVTEFLLIDLTD